MRCKIRTYLICLIVLPMIGCAAGIGSNITKLGDQNKDVRTEAANRLTSIGEPAVPILIEALDFSSYIDHVEFKYRSGQHIDNEQFYAEVAAVLNQVGDAGIVALLEALGDESASAGASIGLTSIGEPIVPMLIETLNTRPTPKVRAAIATVLAKIGEPAVPTLIESLANNNPEVHVAVVSAFARIGEPAVPSLIESLADERLSVRTNAIEAFIGMGQEMSLLAESEVLVRKVSAALTSENPKIHTGVIIVLAQLLRSNRLVSLSLQPDREMIKSLIRAFGNTDSAVRSDAVFVLSKIGKPAVPALIESLGDESSGVRANAITVLGEIGRPAMPALKQAFKTSYMEENEVISESVTGALKKIGITIFRHTYIFDIVDSLEMPIHEAKITINGEEFYLTDTAGQVKITMPTPGEATQCEYVVEKKEYFPRRGSASIGFNEAEKVIKIVLGDSPMVLMILGSYDFENEFTFHASGQEAQEKYADEELRWVFESTGVAHREFPSYVNRQMEQKYDSALQDFREEAQKQELQRLSLQRTQEVYYEERDEPLYRSELAQVKFSHKLDKIKHLLNNNGKKFFKLSDYDFTNNRFRIEDIFYVLGELSEDIELNYIPTPLLLNEVLTVHVPPEQGAKIRESMDQIRLVLNCRISDGHDWQNRKTFHVFPIDVSNAQLVNTQTQEFYPVTVTGR